MSNQELTIGKVDPSSNSAYDISNSQYILNWIGAGGDQQNSDFSGNNYVNPRINPQDLSYNISDNNIGFYFSDMCNNNINVRDAQHIMNNQIDPVDISYSYPASKDFICLVVLEEVTINDKLYYKNKLYLKRKNIKYSPTNPDTSFNPLILANCIPYLSLENDKGNIVKRNDDVNETSSLNQLYEFGFDENGDLSRNYIASIPVADYRTGQILYRNVNNLFPPIKDFSDNYTWLGINDATLSNSNSDIKYTTKFNSPNNQEVTLRNRGVQSIDMSNNTLTLVDTLCPNTTNLLNDLGFNKTSWFSAGQNVNTTQGHFVGQFVFDASATGTMIYQYYYSEKLNDNLPSEKSPYNIYFNISGGKLQFPEQWPDIVPDLNTVATTESPDSKVPWARDSNGIFASIYADIFKQEGLRWYYYTIDGNTVRYKKWKNFRIEDFSCLKTDPGNWANYSAAGGSPREQIYEHAYNSVIGILRTNFPAFTLAESFSIHRSETIFSDGIRSIYNSNITENRPTIEYIWDTGSIISDTGSIISGARKYSALNYPKLKFIAFNNSISFSGTNIFNDNQSLKTIILPASVEDIHDNSAFKNAKGLTTLIFMGQQPSNFPDLSFNLTNLENIYYSEGRDLWTDTSFNHKGPNGEPGMTTTISQLPYNNNILLI